MSNKYIIFTDSTADLPEEYMQENNLVSIPLYYLMGDVTYGGENSLRVKEFYDKMRDGMMPTTSGSNPDYIKEQYVKYIEQGYDVLHICFSSGLSVSAANAFMVQKEVSEEYPDAKIICIDSLAASMGQGLYVYYAVENQKNGMSIDENAKWLEEHKLNFCHQFTVEDLFHLHRGGRVSKATAIIGTMVNIKPILHVDNEGKLVALSKTRGRKKSLNMLVDNMIKTMGSYADDNKIVFISHGDSLEDAKYVAEQVKERTGIDQFMINPICPTIGAHAGPGTIALFFLGDER